MINDALAELMILSLIINGVILIIIIDSEMT